MTDYERAGLIEQVTLRAVYDSHIDSHHAMPLTPSQQADLMPDKTVINQQYQIRQAAYKMGCPIWQLNSMTTEQVLFWISNAPQPIHP